MTAVRPPLWPQASTQPVNRAPSPGAGQRAFFDAAMGRAAAAPTQAQPAPAVTPVRAQAYPQPRTTAAPQPPEGEVRYRRPGSIIDIRV